jgi:hypothetical protein
LRGEKLLLGMCAAWRRATALELFTIASRNRKLPPNNIANHNLEARMVPGGAGRPHSPVRFSGWSPARWQQIAPLYSFPTDEPNCDAFLDDMFHDKSNGDQLNELRAVGFSSVACGGTRRSLGNVGVLHAFQSEQLTQRTD